MNTTLKRSLVNFAVVAARLSAMLPLQVRGQSSLATLMKIQQYVAGGGEVISVGHAPSVDAEGQASAEVTSLSRQLFDLSKSSFVADGAGLEDRLGSALRKAVMPDLQLSSGMDEIGFIRRKLADADVYLVANTSNHAVSGRAVFATTKKLVSSGTPIRAPFLLDR